MKRYDIVIVGGGAAGLSLAYHLAQSPLREQSILVVDRSSVECRGHTWAFWTDRPTFFDSIVYRSWKRLQVQGNERHQLLDLGRYSYKVICGIDFHRFVHEKLSCYPNIEFLKGNVERVADSTGGATISVGGQEYAGDWLFDSRFSLADFHPDPRRYHYLKMQFRGCEIETSEDCFDPQVARFLDFRTPQQGGSLPRGEMCFLYVLPYSHRKALIEHVVCTDRLFNRTEQDPALERYIHDMLDIAHYTVVAREQGVNPMTDYRFRRREGRHVMSIGVRAGMLKPTTGFAFTRIQRDSASIVRSLSERGHPFEVPGSSWIYRLCDSLLLHGMTSHGRRMGSVLSAFFRYGSAERILRFLD